MEGEMVGGWCIERVIDDSGDVHAFAVARDGVRGMLHIVAPGASSTLLHAVTANRTLVVRGKHEGRVFVVTTATRPRTANRTRTWVLATAVLVLVAAGAAAAYAVRHTALASRSCADCVLVVDGNPISTAAYRMYVSDPYVLPARSGDDKKHAALDLLIVRSVLHARAQGSGVSVSLQDVVDRAKVADFAMGLQTIDVRAKLAEIDESFDDATIDRYAKAVGLADRQQLFDEMRIERMAIAARAQAPDFDAARACASAKVVVDARVAAFLTTPYRPCSTTGSSTAGH